MELLAEIWTLVKEGLYTSIICLFLFWLLPIQKVKPEWLLEVLMRAVVIFVAWLMVWLDVDILIIDWTKEIWKQAVITLAFSSFFYEFAGKFIVRKWFDYYKEKELKKILTD